MEELDNKYYKTRPRITKRGWLEVFPEARPYLKEKLVGLKERRKKLKRRVKGSLLRNRQFWSEDKRWFPDLVVEAFAGADLNEISEEIRRIEWILREPEEGEIGRMEIERAKKADWGRFISVKRKHFALCPFHDDHHPSLYVKNGFGFCFACNWSGDLIDLLQERDGMSFKEAVRAAAS